MADQRFPDWAAFRDDELINPRGDDPLTALLTLVHGDVDRWAAVGRQLAARQTAGMDRDTAIASIKADLEAGRL